MINYSVIVPFYNEEENLPSLHDQLSEVLKKLKLRSEIVYVDDGSRDRSLEILKKTVRSESRSMDNEPIIKIVELKKNFGQTAAVSAGIDNSEGVYVSLLDADLQNDPGDLPNFVKKINEGYDAVFGWRKNRRDATLRSVFSKVANLLINRVFDYPFHDVGCSARIVKREYLKDLDLYGELHRIMPVLIYLKGAKIGEMIASHRKRSKGKSKYGFNRIIKTLIDIITVKFLTSYGTKPSYVFGSLGFGSILMSGFALTAVIFRKLFFGVYIYSDPLFLITIFLAIVGIQFILMGLQTELQVRTYFESQNKTIYEIRNIIR